MGKALIIAEKPSVATDISKAMGGFTKKDDYFESDQFVLSSAVGHLLELVVPDQFEIKRGKWKLENLPVIPDHFDLKPIPKTESRLKQLLKLIKRKDVDSLINACDAGREGELIFRYLVQFSKSTKPIQRLWLQSMTPTAIRDGFQKLRSDSEMIPLANAAICRSEADWLVGINGTRAMTAFNSKEGGFQKTTVGRVQTPTLAIVVGREDKIQAFKPRDYWELHGTFQCAAGEYVGRWFDESFQRKKDQDVDLRPERIWEKAKAEAIKGQTQGRPGAIEEVSKPSSQLSPLLFDLTSLQREANSRFGFSAKQTLQIAQALYERHKVLTYPRTDSRALPEDFMSTVKTTLGKLENNGYQGHAGEILKQNWVGPNKRIFNNAKISDHYAIIPTSEMPKKLNDAEAKLYDFVTRRFLAVFFPAAEFRITTRITRVEGEPFKTEGKVLVKPGWLSVYGKQAQGDSDPQIVPVEPNEVAQTREVELKDFVTKPPARFSEATLLSAMEGAGKLVEEEELREAMSGKGLGTPATRAAIIEGLLTEQYIVRQGRELISTAKAKALMQLLNGLGIPELCSAELTGEWEFKLKEIEQNKLVRPQFMTMISDMTRTIVGKAQQFEGDTVEGAFESLKTPCPKCGGEVQETYRKFNCKSCDFAIWKTMGGRIFEPQEAEELITNGKIGPLEGFRSRLGRAFSAEIKLNGELKAEFDFGQDAIKEEVDFSDKTPLGKCPKCSGKVYEHGTSYICDHATGENGVCDFRSGTTILQRKITEEEMKSLLNTGRTPLLKKFISKKGRPFNAFLVVDGKGKVGFEFEQREPKKPAASKTKTAATSATPAKASAQSAKSS
jgi:DNA topoisomerase-3